MPFYKTNVLYKTFLIFLIGVSLIIISACNDSNKSKNTTIQGTPAELLKLNKQINEKTNDPDLYYLRAEYFFKNEKFNEALNDINKAIGFDKKMNYYILLSDIYLMSGKTKEANTLLLNTIDKFPQEIMPVLRIARLYLVIKEYSKAFIYLNKAHTMDKNNAEAFFLQGLAFLETGDTSKAIINYQTTVEKDQNHFEAYMQLGDLFALKKSKLAPAYYDNALRINPQSIEALYAKGFFCQENSMENKAIDAYKRIIAIDPNYKYAYFNIGYINLVYLINFSEAITYFDKAIQKDPKYYEAWFNKGYANELIGNYPNARKAYEEALKIEINYSNAIQGLNRLDELQKNK
ncbi:MAG: tetratricopeptide repeat protein [Lentimicrobiaceae bacterium]|nr:tetratricopeptide repeat protein [Lentimicrobiaceae bacterium]